MKVVEKTQVNCPPGRVMAVKCNFVETRDTGGLINACDSRLVQLRYAEQELDFYMGFRQSYNMHKSK